jgi:fatty acid desaturase
MQVRNAADYRTLFWAFVLFPLVPTIEYVHPAWAPFLLPAGLYLAFTAGVLVHNQGHCPVFASKNANFFYALWLSVFYGFPIFSWIPTHNRNHHRFLNGEYDVTRTWRLSQEDTLLNALVFPLISSYWQSGLLARFVADARAGNRNVYRAIVAQSATVAIAHGALWLAAVALHGAALGSATYALGFGVPALFAPWVMMFVNYVQHVHCDPSSSNDHSRNFVSPVWNWFAFNAGYHTVHHERPGVHWSRYAALHELRAAKINSVLNEQTMVGFCFRNYVLGAAVRRFRSHQIGKAPWRDATTLEARIPPSTNPTDAGAHAG